MRTSWRSSPFLSGLVILLGLASAVYLAIKTPLLFPLILLLVVMAAFILHRKFKRPKNKKSKG